MRINRLIPRLCRRSCIPVEREFSLPNEDSRAPVSGNIASRSLALMNLMTYIESHEVHPCVSANACEIAMNHENFIVAPGKKARLRQFDPDFTGDFAGKGDARDALKADIKRLAEYQEILYAQNSRALLLVFQAMDAAGKDSAIKHVMSGVNPQGCQVFSFKAPSAEELDHDFMWRCLKVLPERGRIGIFNRSYYEEVLVVRVHPEFLEAQRLPGKPGGERFWRDRFEDINAIEKYLVRNGISIVKFFLNVSRGEQKKRFLDRIERQEKNWKFSMGDIKERAHWDAYMDAYEDMLTHTSTEWAPWYVIPANHKWFTRAVVADVIVRTLKSLDLEYPETDPGHIKELDEARTILETDQS
jgi:PPK2 family polyphosphate:nucleotide phosphotransferase